MSRRALARLLSRTTQLRDAPHPRSAAKIAAFDECTGAAAGSAGAEQFALYRMVG